MDVVKGSRNQNEDKDDIEIRFMGVLQNVDVACTHASLTLLLALLLTLILKLTLMPMLMPTMGPPQCLVTNTSFSFPDSLDQDLRIQEASTVVFDSFL